MAHRSEMGTTTRTSLPMVAADYLDADWNRVKIEQAIGDPKYGDQSTDGSYSIRAFYDAMRQTGATARTMLVQAAAQQWKVPVSECSTDLHVVVHKASGRKLGYGELTMAASKLPVPKKEDLQFKRRVSGGISAKAPRVLTSTRYALGRLSSAWMPTSMAWCTPLLSTRR